MGMLNDLTVENEELKEKLRFITLINFRNCIGAAKENRRLRDENKAMSIYLDRAE